MQSTNTEKATQIGLSPALKRDQIVALSLSLWCIMIVGLLFIEMFSGAPAIETEYNLGGLHDPPGTAMGLIVIMWTLFVSVFLAIFMKQRGMQVLWVLLGGCLPAWLLLVLGSLEYLPDAIVTLFFVLMLFELLMMLVSVVYLGNFWVGWLKGKNSGPSFKSVSLQFGLLVILLIVFTVIY